MDERCSTGRVPLEHPSFAGHFPGDPLVPGVVILDWVQAFARAQWVLGPLRGVPAAKFLAPLRPGQDYAIDIAREGAAPRLRFKVEAGGALVAQGTLEFAAA